MTDKLVACFVLYDTATHRALMENRPEYNNGNEHWVYPGGKLEFVERADDAMRREMWQEIRCAPIDYELLSPPVLAANGWTCYGFLVTAWSGTSPDRVLDTGAPLRWISPYEIACAPVGMTARQYLARRTCRKMLGL